MSTNVKSPPPRPTASPEEGWVEVQAIRNAFTVGLRKLDELIPLSQTFPIRQLVTELFESTKFEIVKHRKTPQEVLQIAAPEVRAEMPNQKEAHEKRMAGIKGRQ